MSSSSSENEAEDEIEAGALLDRIFSECEELLRSYGCSSSTPQTSEENIMRRLRTKLRETTDIPYVEFTDIVNRLVNLHEHVRASNSSSSSLVEVLIQEEIMRKIGEQHVSIHYEDLDPSTKEEWLIDAPEGWLFLKEILMNATGPLLVAIGQGLQSSALGDQELYAKRVKMVEKLNTICSLNPKDDEERLEYSFMIDGVQRLVQETPSNYDEDSSPEEPQDFPQMGAVQAQGTLIATITEPLVSDLEQQVAVLTARNEELEVSLTSKDGHLRSSIAKNYGVNQENTRLKKKVATLEAVFEEATTTSTKTHQKEIAELRDQIDDLTSALADRTDDRVNSQDERIEHLKREVLKAKESVAEANEDLLSMGKINEALAHDNVALEGRLTECQQKSTERDEQIQQLEEKVAELEDLIAVGVASRELLVKQKDNVISVNTRLKSSLTEANTYYAALVKANEQLEADGAKKDAELKCTLEMLSEAEDQMTFLKAQLEETSQALDQATSTITAANMHDLTAEIFRLEQELQSAHDRLVENEASLRLRSRSHNIADDSSDSDIDDFIDLTEASDWHNGVPIAPIETKG